MTKKHHFSAKPEGYTSIVRPDNSDLSYIELGRLYLSAPGSSYTGHTGDREAACNILSGTVNLTVTLKDGTVLSYEKVGSRKSMFSGSPAMVYLPRQASYTFTLVKGPFDAAVYHSPCTEDFPPCVVEDTAVETTLTGRLNWSRFVRQGIGDNVAAQRLLVGETLNPSGNWSGYPPHKHDELREPFEKPSEEVYWFHFDKPEGFAMIRLYTPADAEDPFDEAYVVRDGDIITIRRGYHCISVAPGYRCCYLFCLAGDVRGYGAWSDDPAHAWIRKCDAILQGNTDV